MAGIYDAIYRLPAGSPVGFIENICLGVRNPGEGAREEERDFRASKQNVSLNATGQERRLAGYTIPYVNCLVFASVFCFGFRSCGKSRGFYTVNI